MKVVVGVIAFLLVAALAVLVVYPFVFSAVLGLFENNDLGTIIALAACALITVPLIWLAVGLTVLSVIFTSAAEDTRRFKRERARRSKGITR
jgi:hypothetical protein